MQRLLALDPNARHVPLWTISADPTAADARAERRRAWGEAGKTFEALRLLSPDAFGRLAELHNMSAGLPEEEIMLM